jgi:hypothetical protein
MVVLQKEGSCSQKSRTNSSFCEFFLLLSIINCSFFFQPSVSTRTERAWLAQKFTKFRKLIAKV